MNQIQQDLHSKAISLSQTFQKTEAELIEVLGRVYDEKVHLALGLSESNAYAENHEEWIEKAETLTKNDLEKEVAKVNPVEVKESARPIADDRIQIKLSLSSEAFEKLKRAQALISNQKRRPASLEEVFEASLDIYLEKKDPVQKAERNNSKIVLGPKMEGGIVSVEQILIRRTPIPAQIKNRVLVRDKGKCSFISETGIVCGSQYFVDLHHIQPIAEGGSHSVENLTILCRAHHSYSHSYSHSHRELKSKP